MSALECSYHAASNPEDFDARCRAGTAPELPPYWILTIGPVAIFADAAQLREIRQAIDAALVRSPDEPVFVEERWAEEIMHSGT